MIQLFFNLTRKVVILQMGRIKRYRTPQGDKFFDTGTSNVSFLQLAMDLKTLGVKNYFFYA